MSSILQSKFLIPLCFLTVYVVWGSTYMFITYAVEEIPPFFVSGLRYLASSLILFGLLGLWKSNHKATKNQIKNALIVGVLFIGLGSCGMAWSLVRMDSGFTALLVATQPLITVNMVWLLNKKRPSNSSFLGVFLGLIGAYLLISQDQILATPDQWLAVAVITMSLFVWAYATIFVNKGDLPKSSLTSTAYQLLSGGAMAFALSFLMENPSEVAWDSLKMITWWSVAILIIFGGLIVFIAFNYLLQKTTPEKVATTTYVNPVIALLLGWWFLDELITLQSIVAAAIMLTGVVFINFEWKTLEKWLSWRKIGRFLKNKRNRKEQIL